MKKDDKPPTPEDFAKISRALLGPKVRFGEKLTEDEIKQYVEILIELLKQLGPAWLFRLLSEGLSPCILVPRSGGIYHVSQPLPVSLDTNNATVTHRLQLWQMTGSPAVIWPTPADPKKFYEIAASAFTGQLWIGTPVGAGVMTASVPHELRLFLPTSDTVPVARFGFVPVA